MIPPARLRALRNHVPIAAVIRRLGVPTKRRGCRVAFRCPACQRFDTALSRRTNLARCFACKRSFNPIELVMAERASTFLAAADLVAELLDFDQ